MNNKESFYNDPVIKRSQENTNFRAIKSLVTTQNSLRVAQNRIRVLEANQNKNYLKIKNQLETIQKIQKVRQAENQHNSILQEGRQSLQKWHNEALSKNRHLKQDIKDKISKHISQIQQVKKELYIEIQQKSEIAAKKIELNKMNDQKEKQENRLNVKRAEQNSKINLFKFYETKQMRLKDNKTNQISFIKQKQSAKQRELRDLGNLEMELIQRQSQSQAAYLQVKQKLDSLLNNVKQHNKDSKVSLKVSMHISKGGQLS